MMKRILPIICLSLIMLFSGGCSSSQSQIVLDGVVETTIFSQYCEVSGKISKLPIELGQQVKAGDLIAEIDDSNQQYILEQLNATLAKKKASLADLKSGSKVAEIKQGENNVLLSQKAYEKARLTYERANQDYERAKILFEAEAIAKSALDDAKYMMDLAETDVSLAYTQLDNAKQKLTLLLDNVDQEKITYAEADIVQTESQIRQEQANLAKFKITAVSDGTIISRNYLLGDIVSPGYNLAEIASESEKYLIAYLPKDYLQNISYGQEVVIRNGKGEYKGIVSFIDVKAQYTPKDMQTAANKNKDSFKIKVRLATNTPFKAGERADLLIERQ